MPITEEVVANELAELWVNRYTDSFRFKKRALTLALLLAISNLLEIGLVAYTFYTFKSWRPLVYRVDEHHRAIAEEYSKAAESWNAEDAKVDIEDFLRYYLTKDKQTISSADFGFPRSLWYLSSQLATVAKQRSELVMPGGCAQGSIDTCSVATFLSDGLAPSVSIRIANTVVHNFKPPGAGKWQAVSTFWEDLTTLGTEKKSVLNTATVTAEFIDPVPVEYLPSNRNPRGLVISDLKIEPGYAQ